MVPQGKGAKDGVVGVANEAHGAAFIVGVYNTKDAMIDMRMV